MFNSEDRVLLIKALNKAIKVLDKQLGSPDGVKFKIEAREIRTSDYSLGESITIDNIKEFQEKKTQQHYE